MIPAGVGAVLFDAVGTLIHPEPPAAVAYALIGRRFRTRLSPIEVSTRFRCAFRRQEEEDARAGHRTDEERELRRWRAIVAEALDDVEDLDACFAALYDHFAQPAAWRADRRAAEVIAALRQRGLIVALASNFDRRLREVVAGLPALAGIGPLVISSEVGWKKPAPGFFEAACAAVSRPAEQVLLVGDDEENDYHGARRAGLHALLLNPGGGAGRIAKLRDLLSPLPPRETRP